MVQNSSNIVSESSPLLTLPRLRCLSDAWGSGSEAPGPSFHSLLDPHATFRGSEFLRGPSDLCPCAICLAERLHMALFVRGLRHMRATGALHQRWQVILIIIGKTVTAVTNEVFDYTATQSLCQFSRIMPLYAFDQRQTICSNDWNEYKTTLALAWSRL